MPRQVATTDQAPPPAGAYSQSARAGQVVWAAGQGGFDPVTGDLAGDDVAAQTRQTLLNLQAVLAASGATLDDVVRVGVFITTPDDFAAMNEVYAEFWGDEPPARTTVSVGLPGKMKVEIDALAVVDG
jgi:2-iminobutanoate/2-iminopropanoate deaminase